MFGESWEAHNQLAIASVGNPHLEAILPVAVSMDIYDAAVYRGGVYNTAFLSVYGESTGPLEPMITPVDGDDGTLLAQALAERKGTSLSVGPSIMRALPYRDAAARAGGNLWDHLALYPLLDGVNRSGVPVYLTTGWYDILTTDTLQWYDALTGPKRLLVRPLDHSQLGGSQADIDFAAEARRWFDYWLKGIDNGIVDEPPVHYHVLGADKRAAWEAVLR
jgi:putative CocE/NonD family hydrolase